MTLQDVTSRIATIQQQLAMLAPSATTSAITSTGVGGTGTAGTALSRTASGASFTQALDGVLAGTETADLPETGSLADLVGTTSGGSASGQAVVARAQSYLGIPYVWGGTDPSTGLDCSGLVQRVYRDLGIELPRVSRDQARVGTAVAGLDQAQPGDLLAFGSPVHHIGIYVGDGQMIEAPRTGLDVRVSTVSETPSAIRRVIDGGASPSTTASPGYGVTPTATVSGRVSASTPYQDLFTRAAGTYGIDAGLLAAVARQESGFDSAAVSPAGAQGLMQLMPATARGLGVTDSFDPEQAVDGAARLLSSLMNRFGSTDLALAAYNAGPGAVLRYGGVPPYAETQQYVRSVMSAAGAR